MIVIDATVAFAKRYANLAFKMAQEEADEGRRAELLEMSRVLNKVPYEPADTFYEAVQALWLVHLCLQIESNGHSLSYGRMDQYLNPYYEKDLKEGRITEEAAYITEENKHRGGRLRAFDQSLAENLYDQ